jgi:hypothetical protein
MRRPFVTTLVELVGGALVAVGVGMWQIPAGLVVAGAELIAVGYLEGRK